MISASKPLSSAKTNSPLAACVEEISVERLVQAARRGHRTAFDTLCQRYSRQLFRITNRLTRNREDAEDAVQDALLRAFLHIRDFDGRSAFATWLTRIAINSALMILRKKRSCPEMTIDGDDDSGSGASNFEVVDRAPNAEKQYLKTEEEGLLKKAVRRLRPGLRDVIEIQQLQERSLQEAAEVIGISVAAVKGRLFHARMQLRKSPIIRMARRRRAERESQALTAA